MAFPDDLTVVTVTHTIADPALLPLPGVVVATPTGRQWKQGEGSILPAEYTAAIEGGTWTLELPAVDQFINLEAYRIEERPTEGGKPWGRPYHIAPTLEHAPGPVDATDVITTPPRGGDIVFTAGPATDESMAQVARDPDSEFAAELSSTIGVEVGAQVPDKVAQALAEDDTVAQAAAAAADQAITNAGGVAGLAPVDAPLAPRRRFMSALDQRGTRMILTPADLTGWAITQPADSGSVAVVTDRPGPFSRESIKMVRETAAPSMTAASLDVPIDLDDGPLILWAYQPDAPPRVTRVEVGSDASNYYQWDRSGTTSDTANSSPHLDGWTAFELFPEQAFQVGTPPRNGLTWARIRLIGNAQTAWVGGVGQRLLPTRPDESLLYPNGVITLFFDDGYTSQYTHALPVLARHQYPGVLAAIAAYIGTHPSFCTIEQLREMQDRAGWEIAGHSYSPNGAEYRFDQFTPDELEAEFRNLKTWLVSHGFDTDTWVSPGGVSRRDIWRVGRRYFSNYRGVGSTVVHGAYSQSPRAVYPASHLSPNFDTTAVPVSRCLEIVDAVKVARSWGSLAFHQVTDTGPSSGGVISVADLTTIVDAIHDRGIAVRTVKQLMEEAN